MPQVEIILESEQQAGWRFTAQVLDDHGNLTRHHARLSWADYNLWSADGSDPPERVIEAAVSFLLLRMAPSEVPTSFDASIARRLFADADAQIPKLIR